MSVSQMRAGGKRRSRTLNDTANIDIGGAEEDDEDGDGCAADAGVATDSLQTAF